MCVRTYQYVQIYMYQHVYIIGINLLMDFLWFNRIDAINNRAFYAPRTKQENLGKITNFWRLINVCVHKLCFKLILDKLYSRNLTLLGSLSTTHLIMYDAIITLHRCNYCIIHDQVHAWCRLWSGQNVTR